MSVKLTIEEFIKRAKEIHNDKYDYSLLNYTKSSENVIIICDEHGIFEQRASNHLMGRGCYSCKKTRKYDNKKFIEMSNNIHKNRYRYDKTVYDGSHNNVIITCLKHGDFIQIATNHLIGKGCLKCSYDDSKVFDFFEIVNLVHENKYTYYDDYINMRSKIDIMCPKHGIFRQRAKNHKDGQGCPICSDNFGIKENKWLDSLGIKERQFRIGKYVVDGYDDETKTIYEFNGDFWHGNPKLYNENDVNNVLNRTFGELYKNTINRENYLIEKGYKIISIWENDFK